MASFSPTKRRGHEHFILGGGVHQAVKAGLMFVDGAEIRLTNHRR